MVFSGVFFKTGAQVDCATESNINNLLNPNGCYPEDYIHTYSTDPSYLATFSPISLNVFFWGFKKDSTGVDPHITSADILAAMDYLNTEFGNANICFNLTGYDYVVSNQMYEPYYWDLDNYVIANNHFENNVINIYIPHQLYQAPGNTLRGVSYDYNMFAISMNQIDKGIFIHEMGHCLGLAHTHGGPCEHVTRNPADPNYNADCAGDYVTDTNAVLDGYKHLDDITANCQYIGNGQDCQGTPYTITEADVRNFMYYTEQHCRTVFTTGQEIRMRERIIDTTDDNVYPFHDYTTVINTKPYDLFMRNSMADVGGEPDNHTGVIWYSPDIWVRNNPDGIKQHQNPEYIPNNPCHVYVRIRNKGCEASSPNDQLKVYWAKSNTWFYWPTRWINYYEGSLLMADEMGTVNIPSIPPGGEAILMIDWDIPNPYFYQETNPHQWNFCLLARIVSTNDTMTFPEGMLLPPNTRNNNNVSWHNVSVSDYKFDGPQPYLGGVISTGNPFSEWASFDLEFVPQEDEAGPSIFDEAEVSIELAPRLYDAWMDGGGLSEDISEGKEENIKIVTGENAVLENIQFESHEWGTLYLSFNFLTEEVSDKPLFVYHIIQREAETGVIIGGETYEIRKDPRNLFLAGVDQPTAQNDSITYTATSIGEPALYNWYDAEGNLIWSGTELKLDADKFGKYKLEVIAGADGYKDYKEIEIVSPFSMESMAPNPASGQVCIGYEIGSGNSGYLTITNVSSTISNNYILDETKEDIVLDISGYTSGIYVVSLICNGQIADSKNLIIQ